MLRQLLDRVSQCAPDGFSGVAFRDSEKHHIPGPAFHQDPNSGLSLPNDEITFPMTRYRTVFDLGGTF